MLVVVLLTLIFTPILFGGELGVKLGNLNLRWNDPRIPTTSFDGHAAIYGEKIFDVTDRVGIGVQVEIGYGAKKLGKYYCQGYGDCEVDLTYTTLELNLKNLFKVWFFEIYLGGGVSSNRFGLDARGVSSDKYVGTLAEEGGAGTQVFGGIQWVFKFLGLGAEYKYKTVGVPSVKSVGVATLNIFLRW